MILYGESWFICLLLYLFFFYGKTCKEQIYPAVKLTSMCRVIFGHRMICWIPSMEELTMFVLGFDIGMTPLRAIAITGWILQTCPIRRWNVTCFGLVIDAWHDSEVEVEFQEGYLGRILRGLPLGTFRSGIQSALGMCLFIRCMSRQLCSKWLAILMEKPMPFCFRPFYCLCLLLNETPIRVHALSLRKL